MSDVKILASVAVALSLTSMILVSCLFWLVLGLRKRLAIIINGQLTVSQNPYIKDTEIKLQSMIGDLKRLDEKLLNAAEVMNNHMRGHSRQRREPTETPLGPDTGVSSSSDAGDAENKICVLIDTQPMIFTTVGCNEETKHSVNIADDIFLRAEIGKILYLSACSFTYASTEMK